uniref:Uncharacterized protein n=1 Tax=Palpitomonas bilix TaxID=652834 RepID=A0A7S3G8M0_9EUKA|mmetsp:Transcript_35188/g.91292  ORF Transcript_35188/g.91292 Transcript_35188/m.91292 type:complete len:557 (+) Transcript_35188:48-1718(+)
MAAGNLRAQSDFLCRSFPLEGEQVDKYAHINARLRRNRLINYTCHRNTRAFFNIGLVDTGLAAIVLMFKKDVIDVPLFAQTMKFVHREDRGCTTAQLMKKYEREDYTFLTRRSGAQLWITKGHHEAQLYLSMSAIITQAKVDGQIRVAKNSEFMRFLLHRFRAFNFEETPSQVLREILPVPFGEGTLALDLIHTGYFQLVQAIVERDSPVECKRLLVHASDLATHMPWLPADVVEAMSVQEGEGEGLLVLITKEVMGGKVKEKKTLCDMIILLEAFLRNSPVVYRMLLTRLGLYKTLIRIVADEISATSDDELEQVCFDCLSELVRGNRLAYHYLDTYFSENGNTWRLFKESILLGFVQSNLFLRQLYLQAWQMERQDLRCRKATSMHEKVESPASLARLRIEEEGMDMELYAEEQRVLYFPFRSESSLLFNFVSEMRHKAALDFIRCVPQSDLTLGNVCVLNSALAILYVAKRKGELKEAVKAMREYGGKDSNGEVRCAPDLMASLKVWRRFYAASGMERAALYRSVGIAFDGLNDVMEAVSGDSSSPLSLLYRS